MAAQRAALAAAAAASSRLSRSASARRCAAAAAARARSRSARAAACAATQAHKRARGEFVTCCAAGCPMLPRAIGGRRASGLGSKSGDAPRARGRAVRRAWQPAAPRAPPCARRPPPRCAHPAHPHSSEDDFCFGARKAQRADCPGACYFLRQQVTGALAITGDTAPQQASPAITDWQGVLPHTPYHNISQDRLLYRRHSLPSPAAGPWCRRWWLGCARAPRL